MISMGSVGLTTLTLYILATLHYLLFLITKKDKIAVVGLYASRIGFLTNFLYVVLLVSQKGAPVLFTAKGALSLLSIATISVFLYFTSRYKLHISGIFLTPWATLFMGISIYSKGIPKNMLPVGTVGTLHIIIAFLAYGTLLFSNIASILYLLLEKQLKKKNFSIFYHKLPSLPILESIIYKTITIGFVFITVAMFLGAIWSQQIFGTYWSWDSKQIATLITWFIYAAIIHLYISGKCRGKKLSYTAIGGFLLIVLNFTVVNFIFKGVHSLK